MNDYKKTRCPECGAVNGPGALSCHACGLTLRRLGFAARPVDDDDEDEPPRKPVKKPGPDALRKGPPAKKPARPVDDDEDERRPAKRPSRRDDNEDEDERRPAKKSRRRDEEPSDTGDSIRDNALLNMFFPVGVPLLAMGANYLGVFSILGVLLGGAIAAGSGIKIVGLLLPGLGSLLGFLAIIMGGLSFIIRPKKTTYGSVTGYLRAIIGMVCGLIGLVGGPIVIYILSQMH